MPATLKSSSISGQWMPIGMISKFALSRRSLLQARIPLERRHDLSTIGECHNELSCGEFHRIRVQVSDVNFQSTHAVAVSDGIAGGE
jgi:hypothetical protein